MKSIKIFLVLFFIGFTVSCSVYGVKYNYDHQVNFADLKTFDWIQVPEKAGIDSLVSQRVKNAVNAELKAKGLMMTSSNPDFLVTEHLEKKDKVEHWAQLTDWGYGYRPYGGYRGHGGVSTYEYQEGSFILDFVDVKSKKLIWRGISKAKVQNVDTLEKSEKIINEAVKKMLKKYPPPSSK